MAQVPVASMTLLRIDTDLPGRNYGLDVMRSMGLLMVLIGHSLHFFDRFFTGIHRISHFVINGVEAFFALSGFLIGRILVRQFKAQEAQLLPELRRFLKRRWFKTLPVYYLALAINLLVAHTITGYDRDLNFSFLIFTQNLFAAEFWFFPITYSLAIEEWFYLLFPLFFLLLVRIFRATDRRVLLVWAACVFAIAFTVIRTLRFDPALNHWDSVMRKSLLTRLDCSVYGLVMAVLFDVRRELLRTWRHVLLVAGIVLYFICIGFRILQPNGYFYHVLYFNLVPVSFTLSIPFFYWLTPWKPWNVRVFTSLSLVCFAFYLLHLSPLMDLFLIPAQGKSLFVVSLIYSMYAFTVGVCSILWYKYIELPFTNLRER